MKANWVLALVVVFAGLWAVACGGDDSAALRTEVADLQTQVARSAPTLTAIATVSQPTPYLQPNERWTKGGSEFVVYITPKGAEGVAVINIQVRPTTAP